MIIPPDGYLAGSRALCTEANALLIADEIQSGLGRTGRTFACDHEGVAPDLMLLGKALGGGIVPISAVVGTDEVLGLFRPGEHGSTFGGNPLACAIALAVLELLGRRLAAAKRRRARRPASRASLPAPTTLRSRRSASAGSGSGRHRADGATAREACMELLTRACSRRRRRAHGPLRAAADDDRRRARLAARARQRRRRRTLISCAGSARSGPSSCAPRRRAAGR